MTKMKRSEFKSMVKECVRECLREIMQEQLAPSPIQEMLQPQRGLVPYRAQQVINPMDDRQMRLRNEILQQQNQRGAMQQQMRQQVMPPLSELAGISADDQSPRRYNTNNSGYMSPSDRLKMAGPPVQHHQPAQQARMLHLDPTLDTPVGGGDIRPPDPNVLRSIYEDTARTTYAQQAAVGHVGPGALGDQGAGGAGFAPVADRFAEIVSNHNPDELFPGAQNWGALAFER